MIHRIDISSYLYILMMVFMFICGTSFSQDFITSSNFNKKIAKDIVVVEFWAGWNEIDRGWNGRGSTDRKLDA